MNYTVFTWFKNKTPTFFTFQNFYKKFWNVKNFIYAIGYTTEENKNYILKNYFQNIEFKIIKSKINLGNIMNSVLILECNHNYNFKIILYKTVQKNNLDQWGQIKNTIAKILLPINNLIVVDDDEFIYSNDIKNIGQSKRFHFIEFLPENIFDKNNMEWSIQCWAHTHCLYKEKKEDHKTYYCGGCKKYTFSKGNCWNNYHIHGGKNLSDSKVCQKMMSLDKENTKDNNIIEILKEGVCFHFVSLTFDQLKEIKQHNRFDKNINRGNWRNGVFQDTNKLIKKNIRTIKWNFFSELIDDRDLNFLKN